MHNPTQMPLGPVVIPSPYDRITESNYARCLSGTLSDKALNDYFEKCFEDTVREKSLYACWVCVPCQAEGQIVFGFGVKPDTCPRCRKSTTYAVGTFQAWAKPVGDAFEWAFFRLLRDRYGMELSPAQPQEELFDFALPPKIAIGCKGSPSYILNPDGSKYRLGRPGLERSDSWKKADSDAKRFKQGNPDWHYFIVTNAAPKDRRGYSNEHITRVRDISRASELEALAQEMQTVAAA